MHKINVFDNYLYDYKSEQNMDYYRIGFGLYKYFFPKKGPCNYEDMRAAYSPINNGKKRGVIYLKKEIIQMFKSNDLLNKQLAFEIVKTKLNKLK